LFTSKNAKLSGHVDSSGGVIVRLFIQVLRGCENLAAGDFRGRCVDWCKQNGALMIADEVMTGIGRTGKMFCERA